MDILLKAADALTQKPGCGCAKRQALMNKVIPGSGDLVKAAASATAKGLRSVASLAAKPEIESPSIIHAPNVIVPKAVTQHKESTWTVPPVPALGWAIDDQCNTAIMFSRGIDRIVWTIIGGKYSRSHKFTANPARARVEFESRCLTQRLLHL